MSRLRKVRKEKRVRVADAAPAVGIDEQAWYRYERGAVRLPADKAVQIARYLGVSVEDITDTPTSEAPASAAC